MIQNILDNLLMIIGVVIAVSLLGILLSTILLCMDGPTFHTKPAASKMILIFASIIIVLSIIGCFV